MSAQSRQVPPYMKIVNALSRDIEGGVLKVGDPVPPESALMGRFDVSRGTARRAIGVLREWGLIETTWGRGSRVIAVGRTDQATGDE
ncbi:GntR family transcriptional regulator [Kitasatospora sp. NPDC088779]|uniref:GntR family transcriptional regulator n=1 Tax=Kitasatospora sp. NPDC088779 TaxID=3154964 RepID=UPI00341ECA73